MTMNAMTMNSSTSKAKVILFFLICGSSISDVTAQVLYSAGMIPSLTSLALLISKPSAVFGELQSFFGEDRNSCEFTNRVYADSARDDFVSSLKGATATFDFESISITSEGNATPFDAPLGDITAKFIGDSEPVPVQGLKVLTHHNDKKICAVSGDKALVRDAQSQIPFADGPNSNPAFRVEFSKPVFAFGFYGASVGAKFWIETIDSEGKATMIEIPHKPDGENGHIFFYGIIDKERPFKSVRFISNSWADGWLIDDITISCVSGTYSDSYDGSSCEPCPFQQITANSLVDFAGATTPDECGNFKGVGYWALAQQGSVSPGGTGITWKLERSKSVSDGVRQTQSFAREFTKSTGLTSSFETSTSVGETTSVTGTFGIPQLGLGMSVETSIETTSTSTTGKSYHYEVSESATNGIAQAVSKVITNSESVACSQTCEHSDNESDAVQGYIFNWVQAIYDVTKDTTLHHVRTCSTICKYNREPPKCPPGFCANSNCDVCRQGAFNVKAVDDVFAAPTSPTPSTSSPASGSGGAAVNDISASTTPSSPFSGGPAVGINALAVAGVLLATVPVFWF